MTKLIAETAWHHEGDYPFMKDLVSRLCKESDADIIKMHITLDLEEYMAADHDAYATLKSWMLSADQWEELIATVQDSGKGLMLLLNDTKAIEFAARFNPDIIELHSVCLNVPRLQEAVLEKIDPNTPIVIGVGGCSLQEVDAAVLAFEGRETILMFGFQNYPTKYEDVNLGKIRKVQSLYYGKSFGYADHTGWDEKHNELITLMVAANGMDYVEKHVTSLYGQKRCDYSAAISIEMLNSLAEGLTTLSRVYGNGSLALNAGEKAYSQYGPMKMAAVSVNNIEKGSLLTDDLFHFCRTSQRTDLSQVDMMDLMGLVASRAIGSGQTLTKGDVE